MGLFFIMMLQESD
ncbi:hypothetical protein MTR67_018180 [Solanum verrucosum]|uniref:Uncharacterized protein n=1 Tax=Solanum verrucosum TaxID=315347 RepID=A0AAF0QPA3_SOLVR|nr:hypothetical protein MTR67_018180 [Solanum verrucosum]